MSDGAFADVEAALSDAFADGEDKLHAAPKILAVALGGRTYGEAAEEIYDDYVVYVIKGSSIY